VPNQAFWGAHVSGLVFVERDLDGGRRHPRGGCAWYALLSKRWGTRTQSSPHDRSTLPMRWIAVPLPRQVPTRPRDNNLCDFQLPPSLYHTFNRPLLFLSYSIFFYSIYCSLDSVYEHQHTPKIGSMIHTCVMLFKCVKKLLSI
jgi:hypothetical protein